jgi:hypothetical protein
VVAVQAFQQPAAQQAQQQAVVALQQPLQDDLCHDDPKALDSSPSSLQCEPQSL